MKKIAKAFSGLILIAALFVLGNSLVITYPDEYMIVRQFGEIVRVVETPGVSVKIPFVQTSAPIPKALQIYDIPKSDVITKDKKSMIADAFVLWKISDPVLFTQMCIRDSSHIVRTRHLYFAQRDTTPACFGPFVTILKLLFPHKHYSSSDVMTPTSITLDDGQEYKLSSSEMQFAFSVYGSIRVGDRVTLICEKSENSNGDATYTVVDYVED